MFAKCAAALAAAADARSIQLDPVGALSRRKRSRNVALVQLLRYHLPYHYYYYYFYYNFFIIYFSNVTMKDDDVGNSDNNKSRRQGRVVCYERPRCKRARRPACCWGLSCRQGGVLERHTAGNGQYVHAARRVGGVTVVVGDSAVQDVQRAGQPASADAAVLRQTGRMHTAQSGGIRCGD